jgi:Flp pilus assembly pilin Flp
MPDLKIRLECGRREVNMLLDLYVRAKTFAWSLRDRVMGEDGAVATEYGLLLVLIAIAIVAAATALGLAIAGVFDRGTSSLSGV